MFSLDLVHCSPVSPLGREENQPDTNGGPVYDSVSRYNRVGLGSMAEFGLTVDNVHIHIDHPPAASFDTVVAFPPGTDSVLIILSCL